jgi:hypothetical protein
MFKPRVLCCLMLLAMVACRPSAAPSVKRPAAGDRVTPELHWTSPWRAGQPVPLFVRLLADGLAGTPSVLVGEYDVPEDSPPRLKIVFLKDGVEIAHYDDIVMPALC